MKKLICIICLIVLLVSCAEQPSTIKSEESIGAHSVKEFEYNDHEYIKFNFYASRAGVVHNPDCKCFKKETE